MKTKLLSSCFSIVNVILIELKALLICNVICFGFRILFLDLLNLSCFMVADSVPVALTPDYGGPLVSYADGEFDSRFDRYVTVMEG